MGREPRHVKALTFEMCPSWSSSDHQVRILADGEDVIERFGEGGDLGVDPPEFFSQPNLLTGGRILVGRCDCGVVGCGDLEAEVTREGEHVEWVIGGHRLVFEAGPYRQALRAAAADTSWEDTNREVERLVGEVLRGLELDGGASFQWASARFESGKVVLSFGSETGQSLARFDWDGRDPKAAVAAALAFRRDPGGVTEV